MMSAESEAKYVGSKAVQLLLRNHPWEVDHYRKMARKQGKTTALAQSYAISVLRRKYRDELEEIKVRFRRDPSLIAQSLPPKGPNPCLNCGTPYARTNSKCPNCGKSRFHEHPKAELRYHIRQEAQRAVLSAHQEELIALREKHKERMAGTRAGSYARTQILQKYRSEFLEWVQKLTNAVPNVIL